MGRLHAIPANRKTALGIQTTATNRDKLASWDKLLVICFKQQLIARRDCWHSFFYTLPAMAACSFTLRVRDGPLSVERCAPHLGSALNASIIFGHNPRF